MNRDLNQYFTPSWAAELLFRRHFSDLKHGDVVGEPSCGDGRFLLAVPGEIEAFGVEIDPLQADAAARNTGREIIVGDFLSAKLPKRPTAFVGNPPFASDVIDDFLARCYHELEYGGRVGFVLPAYYFNCASKVVDLRRRWSLSQEMLPRNLFEQLSYPILFAKFTKERITSVSGFFLHEETDAVRSGLKVEIRAIVIGNDSTAHCWRDVVDLALRALGGRAKLEHLYAAIENNRPTTNPWWREKVRQICGMHFVRVAAGEYALEEELGGIAA
ncbi:MAG TPA: class I SAM-dependent methyltransferase [Sideroxyarcus sp.]|nr:class I SAM-dependent methyltransferase [Sideroxyarcus sp.]